MRFGVEIMLEQINMHSTLLDGFKLKVLWQDGQCSKPVGTTLFLLNLFDKMYEVFAPRVPVDELDADGDGVITTSDTGPLMEVWTSANVTPDPVGILGPGCSGTTMNTAETAYYARWPMISGSATRPALSDRRAYPNFFRTILSDSFFPMAWVAMCRTLSVSSLTSVVAETELWESTATVLVDAVRRQNVTMNGRDLSDEIPGFFGAQISSDSEAAAREAAAELLRVKERVVVLLLYANRARLLFCEAAKIGLFNAVYMLFGWFESGWWATEDTDCTAEQLTAQATGFISANMMFLRADADTALSCSETMTAGQYFEEWYARQGADYGDLSTRPEGYALAPEGATQADALCMYAKMLHEVLIVRGRNLSSLSERTEDAYAEVFDVLSNTDFEGIQGRVRFVPGQADPAGSVILQHLQPGGAICDVASYSEPTLSFFGKCDLVFGYPGETFYAGPEGASGLDASLAPYATCSSVMKLDMSTNQCVDCPPGKVYLQKYGNCDCAAGSRQSGSGDGSCVLCSPGRFTSAPGSEECRECMPGWYSAVEGISQCETCPLGTYNSAIAAVACEECPTHMTTASERALSKSDCDCELGRFRRRGSTNCEPCLEGQICAFASAEENFAVYGGNDSVVPLLDVGYYTFKSEPLSVYECKFPELCPGGLPESCLGETTGFLCYRCPSNMVQVPDSETGCNTCSPATRAYCPLAAAASVVAIVGTYYLSNDPLSVKASVSLTGSIAVGLMITILQIFSILRDLNIPWPSTSSDYFSSLSFLVLDTQVLSMQCSTGDDAAFNYLMRVIVPCFLGLIMLLCYAASLLTTSWQWEPDKVFNAFCHVSQAIFIAICVISVRPIECYSHPNGETSIMLFPEVLCWSSDAVPLLLCSLLLAIFYIIPFIAVCVYGNWVAPLQLVLDSHRFSVRFRFLLYRFRPDVWWWGNVYLLRQTLLGFAASLPSDDPHAQIFYTNVTLTSYLALLCHTWPWKNETLNRLDSVSCMVLVTTLLAGTAFAEATSNPGFFSTLLTGMVVLKWCLIVSMAGVVGYSMRGGLSSEFEQNTKPAEELRGVLRDTALEIADLDDDATLARLHRLNAFDRATLQHGLFAWVNATIDYPTMRSFSCGSEVSAGNEDADSNHDSVDGAPGHAPAQSSGGTAQTEETAQPHIGAVVSASSIDVSVEGLGSRATPKPSPGQELRGGAATNPTTDQRQRALHQF